MPRAGTAHRRASLPGRKRRRRPLRIGRRRQLDRRAAIGRHEACARNFEIVRIERDRGAGLEQFEIGAARRGKGKPVQIGRDGDGVVRRGGVARQVACDRVGQRRDCDGCRSGLGMGSDAAGPCEKEGGKARDMGNTHARTPYAI